MLVNSASLQIRLQSATQRDKSASCNLAQDDTGYGSMTLMSLPSDEVPWLR